MQWYTLCSWHNIYQKLEPDLGPNADWTDVLETIPVNSFSPLQNFEFTFQWTRLYLRPVGSFLQTISGPFSFCETQKWRFFVLNVNIKNRSRNQASKYVQISFSKAIFSVLGWAGGRQQGGSQATSSNLTFLLHRSISFVPLFPRSRMPSLVSISALKRLWYFYFLIWSGFYFWRSTQFELQFHGKYVTMVLANPYTSYFFF